MPARWPAPGVAVALLLVLFGVRLVHSAQQNAFTTDEPNYIGTGLYLWESGDYHYFRSLRFHPPLVHHLASLPLLVLGLPEGVTPSPGLGPELVARWEPDPTALRVASRLPFVAIALWGAWLCFAWVREVAGEGAGLLAVFLYTFSPSLLAHGALVHSDITLAVLYLQTLYAFWRWLRRPTPLRLVLCGLSLGLALLAKLTSILLIGTLGLLLLLAIVRRRPASAGFPAPGPDATLPRVAWAAGSGAAILALAVAVVWLGYGGSFASVVDPNGPFPDLALPGWIQSFLFVDHVNSTGRPVYFLGEFSSEGWWTFFPVAFAVKEPIGLLVLTGAALVSLRARRGRLGLYLAVPFAVYLWILLVWLDVPLGYRYALPLLPLLCVFIASQLWPPGAGARRTLVIAACALLAVESLWIHPHYLAYFNALIGGPRNGPRYLLDANIDWGQDVTTLARELASEGNPPVWLALSAPEDPARYGVKGRPLRDCQPVGGRLAISVNVRMGLYNPNNPLAPPRPGCFAWLDRYEPVARPGYSILLYDLPEPARP
jgi:4-amino-4-deoxy-L-arabinose transferase-like glycosyltransferase